MEVMGFRQFVDEQLSPTDFNLLSHYGGDVCVLQPYVGNKGRTMIRVPDGYDDDGKKVYKEIRHPVANAQSLLPRRAWEAWEREVMDIALPELNLAADLLAPGLRVDLPNPFRTPVLMHRKRGQAGSATRSMDLLRASNNDRIEVTWDGIPIPFTHAEFNMSFRELEVSRGAGMPLNDDMWIEETRRIAELTEDWAIGTVSEYNYASFSAPGAINHPDVISASMTIPTDPGWTPETTQLEVLAIMQSFRDIQFYGPFRAYYSPAWSQYLARSYSAQNANVPLRTFLQQSVGEVSSWTQLNRLGSGFKMIFMAMDGRYVGMIDGMPIRPVQATDWKGMEMKFFLYQCQVPRFRSDASGNLPVAYAVAA